MSARTKSNCLQKKVQWEQLERRELMSASPWEHPAPGIAAEADARIAASSASQTNSNSEGKFAASSALLGSATNPTYVPGGLLRILHSMQVGYSRVIVSRADGVVRVNVSWNNGPTRSWFYTGVTKIEFQAAQGGSYIRNDAKLPSILFGSTRDDTLVGGSKNDTINGGAGNDCLRGRGGNDIINGQDGRDRLFGGAGCDRLDGGTQLDKLYGEGDDDKLSDDGFGGYLYGGDGNDKLYLSNGPGYMYGGAGNDELSGTIAPNDFLEMHGGDGRDKLYYRWNAYGDWLVHPYDDLVYRNRG
jgi:hypothetical protein